MQFENVYWDAALMRNDGKYPSILVIGDNGAEAYDYVNGTYSHQIRTALDLYGSRLSAVFISGGGNDFAGINDLRPVLGDNCAACRTAAACLRDGAEKGSLDWLLAKIKVSYTALIDQVIGATWLTGTKLADGQPASAMGATRIFLHNYAYAQVTGQGLLGPGSSPWLQPAFVAAGVDAGLRDECIRIIIDRFNDMLEEIVARYPGRVFLIDSRDALQRADWANELHPTPDGFRKIAERWHPILSDQGLVA